MRAYLGFLAAASVFVLAGCGGGEYTPPTGSGGSGGTDTTGSGGSGGTDTTGSGGTGTAGGGTGGGTGGTGGSTAVACTGKTGTAGDSSIKMMFGGKERDSDLHVPQSYDPAAGTMLVLNFHGYLSDSAQEADITKMTAASDKRGFIVAYPNGTGSSWNAGACCGTAASGNVDDVGYVSALIDRIAEEYCIDEARIFATGMSNGGFLSNRLGCELSDRIAAIAPVAGVMGIPTDECSPGRNVPVMHFHGTSDLVVPYNGNVLLGFISVADSVGRWRELNGCAGTEQTVFKNGDSECVSADGCKGGSEVILCTVDGGGHQWPGGNSFTGGGKTTMDLDATGAMLDFFEKHPMP